MFRVVHHNKSNYFKSLLLLGVGLFGAVSSALADGPPKESSIGNPAVIILLIVIAILMVAIGLLSNVLLGSAEYILEKDKEDVKSSSTPAATMTGLLILVSATSFAQDAATATAAPVQYIKGLSNTAFYSIIGVIAIELIVILFMALQVKSLLARKRIVAINDAEVVPAIARQKKGIKELWSRMNSFRPLEEEAALELHHDYDGIRELDNRLPPWWIYGFYVTIIFAGVYLWRYHVAYSAPSSTEEFQIAMKEAELEKAAYLKKSANNVDENTVNLSSEPSIIESGKKTYLTSCAACHGTEGQGTVGPNLTDEYWLHGGSVSSVFKSIKYGWPEKGMKSWKDDFSPVQISQLTSYIKSLQGTKPSNAKEPQGTIDNEPTTAVDSTAKPVAAN